MRSRERAATTSPATALGLPLTATHAAWPTVLEGVDAVLAVLYLSRRGS